MEKNCVIYLSNISGEVSKKDLVDTLEFYSFQVTLIKDQQTLNNIQEPPQLLITDMEFDPFHAYILRNDKWKNVFILWISSSSYSHYKDSYYIHGLISYKLAKKFIINPHLSNANEHAKGLIEAIFDYKTEILPKDVSLEIEEKKTTDVEKAVDINMPTSRDKEIEVGDATHSKKREYIKRQRTIQKDLFIRQKWDSHKTIGIWSPINRMGVTTFTLNFSFFLAQNRIYTTVLEGISENYYLKDWLKRFSEIPPNWVSFANSIHNNTEARFSDWHYNNVIFLPLDSNDSQLKWDADSIETYMTTSKIVDITLIDLPTGVMKDYTVNALPYLDELWVMVDDSFQETIAWKEYIHLRAKEVHGPTSLIFNKHFSFSQDKRLAEEMNLPMLTTIPSLQEEVMKNYYETKPLYFMNDFSNRIEPIYLKLAKHLFGEDFTTFSPNTEKKKQKIWEVFSKMLKAGKSSDTIKT